MFCNMPSCSETMIKTIECKTKDESEVNYGCWGLQTKTLHIVGPTQFLTITFIEVQYICTIFRLGCHMMFYVNLYILKQNQLKTIYLNAVILHARVFRLTLFKAKMGNSLYRRASFLHEEVQLGHKGPLFTLRLVCSGNFLTAIGGHHALHLPAGLVEK